MGHGALTAIGLLVLAAIVKETVAWLFSGLKTVAASEAARARARGAFTGSNLRLASSIAFLGISSGLLVDFTRDKSPITRWTILHGCEHFFSVVFWLALIALQIGIRSARRSIRKAGPSTD